MQSEEGRRGQEEVVGLEAVSVPGEQKGNLGLDSTIIVDWIMGGQRRW